MGVETSCESSLALLAGCPEPPVSMEESRAGFRDRPPGCSGLGGGCALQRFTCPKSSRNIEN